jgi:hypothetical protein
LTRPDQDGRYNVNGLPAGDYYGIALDYVDANDWNDPQFLEGIRGKAMRVSLADGETKSADLKVSTAQ